LGVFENNQFFLPITKGLMLRSARLLLISSLPVPAAADRPKDAE